MDTQNSEMQNNIVSEVGTHSDSQSEGPLGPSAFYHRGHKAENVAEYLYKIRDDSVRPKEFIGTDTEDGIEAILAARNGHSLHEFIDGDGPLRPFIDFDLQQETLNRIDPQLTRDQVYAIICRAFKEVCLEVYTEW